MIPDAPASGVAAKMPADMKIVIAPDKFKGCLAASAVADAMAAGARAAAPDSIIDTCPIADGGEGFVDAMVRATAGRFETRRVTGPLPEMKVDATFGILGDGTTAVIEMASAAGLTLLRPQDRNPMNTTTFGVGELIRHAVELNCGQILLGIGGSATTDAGIGCCQATGHTIILQDGEPVSPTEPLVGRDLERVVMIKRHRGEATDRVRITVACDVANPLYGEHGAARVFGKQKGASPEEVECLDQWLRNFAGRSGRDAEAQTPGAGAAGGLGFGMLAFYGATLVSGVDVVLQATRLRDRLQNADLCLTGEGRFDVQSLQGKGAIGVARLCRELNIPCVVLAGSIGEGAAECYAQGVTSYFSIQDGPADLDTAIARARGLISAAAGNVVRLRYQSGTPNSSG